MLRRVDICLCFLGLCVWGARGLINACSSAQFPLVNATNVCCNNVTGWCETTNVVALVSLTDLGNYSMLVNDGQTLLLGDLRVRYDFILGENATLILNDASVLTLEGNTTQFLDGSQIRLLNGAFIEVGNHTCLNVSHTTTLVLELSNATLVGYNYTMPALESEGGTLCFLHNQTFGNITLSDDDAQSGFPPVSWSDGTTSCGTGTSLQIAVTIACPPPPLPPTVITHYVPNKNGTGEVLVNTTEPTPYPTTPLFGSVDGAIIIAVIAIVGVGMITIIIAVVLRRSKTCRKRVMPFHDRQHYFTQPPARLSAPIPDPLRDTVSAAGITNTPSRGYLLPSEGVRADRSGWMVRAEYSVPPPDVKIM
jgi:hypothetical protein